MNINVLKPPENCYCMLTSKCAEVNENPRSSFFPPYHFDHDERIFSIRIQAVRLLGQAILWLNSVKMCKQVLVLVLLLPVSMDLIVSLDS